MVLWPAFSRNYVSKTNGSRLSVQSNICTPSFTAHFLHILYEYNIFPFLFSFIQFITPIVPYRREVLRLRANKNPAHWMYRMLNHNHIKHLIIFFIRTDSFIVWKTSHFYCIHISYAYFIELTCDNTHSVAHVQFSIRKSCNCLVRFHWAFDFSLHLQNWGWRKAIASSHGNKCA